MNEGRILALDIGSRRTGVALSDEGRMIAQPLTKIEVEGKRKWLKAIRQLLRTHEVTTILVGLPLDQNSEVGESAHKIRKRIALLQENFDLPVIEWDERFTTAEAEQTLLTADLSRKKRKGVIDQVAAAIILQRYLDGSELQPTINTEEDSDHP